MSNSGGFKKPDAEAYKKAKYGEKGKNTNNKNTNNKNINNKNGTTNSEEEKKKNIVFICSIVVFLIVLIILKSGLQKMRQDEMMKLAETKWYVNDEEDVNKVGNIEVEFKSNGTFDMYKRDTQVTCMNGKYSIKYAGRMHIKCDERGFNPPKAWDCKRKSTFKYKIVDSKLELTYKGVTVKLYKKGGNAMEEQQIASNRELLHKKYFINKQAKMLVAFYNEMMYLYNLDSLKEIFGDNKEVLGEICLSGEYTLNKDSSKIVVCVNEESDLTSNPMWEDMTTRKDYVFYYKLKDNGKKLVLQYGDKAFEFINKPISW